MSRTYIKVKPITKEDIDIKVNLDTGETSIIVNLMPIDPVIWIQGEIHVKFENEDET